MKVHFSYLDALRGIAALSVMLMHASQTFGLGAGTQAYLAVDFFFCLSGFVLANAYDDKLRSGTMTQKQFLAKRLVRLYPMILVGIALGIVACLASSLPYLVPAGQVPILVAGTLLLLPVGLFIGQEAFALNAALWSLCFELSANLFYGFSGRGKHKIIWHVVTWTLLASALCLVIDREGTVRLVGFKNWISFFEGFVRVGFSFCTGVIIFRSRIYTEIGRIPGIIPIILLLSILFFPAIDDPRRFDFVSIVLIIPTVVLLAASTREPRSERRIFLYVGQLSYPLYVIHQPILRIGAQFQRVVLPSVSAWIISFLTILVVLGAAHLFSAYFDAPIRAYLRHKRDVRRGIRSEILSRTI